MFINIAVANTVSMATRDRTQEIGILRSLGFRRNQISTLVLIESMALAITGGVLAIGILAVVSSMGDFTIGIRGENIAINLSVPVAMAGIIISVAVGFMGGFIPAAASSRLNIVNSLRNVD